MFAMFSKLKTRYLILGIVLAALGLAGVIVLYIYKLINNTIFFVLAALLFMLFSSFMSGIFDRILKKKMKYLGFKPKTYNFDGVEALVDKIESLEHKKTEERYGSAYYYKDGIVGYKFSIVTNSKEYFNVDENESINGLPKVEDSNIQKSYFKKCTKLVDFEIFIDPEDEYLRKIGIFNYQGDKFYFASFYTRNDKLIRADYVKPEDVFDKYYSSILELLNITEETKK